MPQSFSVAHIMTPALVTSFTPLNVPSPRLFALSRGRSFSACFFLGFRISWKVWEISPAGLPSRMRRSPTLLPSGGLINSTYVWSALPAQRTIPCDIMSASFLGFRFANTTHRPSVIYSIGTNSCSPDPIVRSYPSPRSIFST